MTYDMHICPLCDCDLRKMDPVGITVHEAGDAQADRFDCPEGHTLLVVETDRTGPKLEGT